MKLTHFFIEHPRFAIVLNVFIVLAGVATMLTLPIAQYPNIVPPTIKVTTLYPGASADVIARTVATPLEQQFSQIPGVTQITSSSFFEAVDNPSRNIGISSLPTVPDNIRLVMSVILATGDRRLWVMM